MRRMHRHNPDNFTPHIPLKMKSLYSDALYQPWMNSALIIDPSWFLHPRITRARARAHSHTHTHTFTSENTQAHMDIKIVRLKMTLF